MAEGKLKLAVDIAQVLSGVAALVAVYLGIRSLNQNAEVMKQAQESASQQVVASRPYVTPTDSSGYLTPDTNTAIFYIPTRNTGGRTAYDLEVTFLPVPVLQKAPLTFGPPPKRPEAKIDGAIAVPPGGEYTLTLKTESNSKETYGLHCWLITISYVDRDGVGQQFSENLYFQSQPIKSGQVVLQVFATIGKEEIRALEAYIKKHSLRL